jgi:hemerythrin-like domain-containing protein
MSTTVVPDTHEMVVIHRVFRREFGLLPELIGRVPEGDVQRAAVVAGHLGDVVFALHHHHQGEDDLLWPPLLEKAELQAELVHRMEAQHEALAAALERVEKVAPAWTATAMVADRDELVRALREAAAILNEHMGEEERKILPLVREHLSAELWDKLGERGAKAIQDKRKRLIFLGMILEEAAPEEEQGFLAKMPGPVRVLWRLIGRRQYDAYTRRVRAA